jgi:hypothetical protein
MSDQSDRSILRLASARRERAIFIHSSRIRGVDMQSALPRACYCLLFTGGGGPSGCAGAAHVLRLRPAGFAQDEGGMVAPSRPRPERSRRTIGSVSWRNAMIAI